MMDTTRPNGVDPSLPLLRALILEKNPRDAKLTASLLERGGFRVQFEVTDSAESFRERLEKADCDVIMADFKLPNWTALDALEILKQSGKDIPLIVVTGSLGDETAVECIKRGAADFVLKDRPAQLPAAVRRALEEKRLRTENQRAFESISQLAVIVESSDAAIVGTTLEGVIKSWNASAEKLYGYSATEVLGQPVSVLVPPDRAEESAQMLASLRQGALIQHLETVRLRKDGSRVDISLGIFPLRDPGGEIIGAASISRDISEPKRAEEALRDREERFRRLSEASFEGIAFSEAGKVVDANPRIAEMLGCELQDLIGSKATEFVAAESLEFVQAHMRSGSEEPYEHLARRKDGSIFPVEVRGATVPWKGRLVRATVIRDITERKRAEEAWRASEQFIREIVANAQEGVIVYDREFRYRLWNHFMEEVTGEPASEVLGKCAFDIFPHLREQKVDLLLQRALAGEVVHAPDVPFHVRKTGKSGWVSGVYSPHFGASGEILGVIGMVRDITERKRVEEALRESEELYRSVVTTVAEGIVLLDRGGTIVACNRSAERMFDFPSEKLIGRTQHDLPWQAIHEDGTPFPGEDLPYMVTLRTGKPQSNVCLGVYKPDGTLVWILANAQPIFHKGDDAPYAVVTSFSDITERKRAEGAILQSEERYRTLFENAPVGIYRTTPDGRVLVGNPAFVRMFGCSSFEELAGRDLNAGDIASEYPRKQFVELMEKSGKVNGLESAWHKPGGEVLHVRESARAIRDESGRILYYEGTLEDITERKRMELALLESERRYRDFIAHSHEGVWRIELERPLPIDLPQAETVEWIFQHGYVAECNLALARLWGFSTAEEPIGKRLKDVLGGGEELIGTIRPGAPGRWQGRTIEVSRHDPAGNLRHFLRTEIPIVEDGKVVRIWGISSDRTEIKKAEAERARLAAAIEQSAEVVVITDTGGNIEYVNPAFTRVTGYSREEALGQNPRFLKSGKHDPAFYQQLWATILKGEVWHGEVINRKKDGTLYTGEMNIAPVRNPAGEVVNFIATKQDVTARQELQQQLRQAQKMEAVGQLAGGVAHDFNNILTIISGYGQLLKGRLSPQDLDHLEEILKAGDRATTLTRQLLAFSRRQVLDPQVLDLNSIVANLEKMLRRLIGENIELTTVQQSGLGPVKADPGQIEQVIMNLVVNARDAMPKGGKLTIETANVNLDEAYARSHVGMAPGPQVMLAVSDTGTGMDAETLAHMFEPFFTTKEKGKGTGLGLATVYGIVKQSSGYIMVSSEPGRGSAFKVYLPRVDEPAPKAGPPKEPTKLAKGSETVLVVEDEDSLRSLVCETLKSKGYKVLEGREPVEALKIVEQYAQPIHLLLTDVVMPRMSGKELATRLTTVRPKMKVLYMSGYTDDAIVHHGILEAGTFFLQKPFMPSTLLRKVREVLDTKRKEG